jgi:hypothetical protein
LPIVGFAFVVGPFVGAVGPERLALESDGGLVEPAGHSVQYWECEPLDGVA